ncbi:hypothetical protein ACMFMG_009309 [Clarireedia jacksonii]
MVFSSQPQPALAEAWDTDSESPTENLSTLLSKVATKYPDQNALISLHQSSDILLSKNISTDAGGPLCWTYSQLQQESVRLARCLSSHGVTAGSSVITVLFNQAQWCLFFWATAHLGCQFVPLDPRSLERSEDAKYLLGRVKVSAIVVATEKLAIKVDEVMSAWKVSSPFRCIASRNHGETIPSGWKTLFEEMAISDNISLPALVTQPGDPAIMFFTSGTTSLPKACPLSGVNICSPAFGYAKKLLVGPGHSLCQHLPAFHISSVVTTLAFWLTGGTVVYPSPSFDPGSSIKAIEECQNVHLPCVPLMAQAIAAHTFRPKRFDSLNCVTLGGAPVLPEVLEIVKGLGSKRIAVGYGLSEGVVTLLNVMDADSARPSSNGDVSVGQVLSGAKVRICAPSSRVPLRRGQIGELHQGGFPVFNGYLDLNHETTYEEDGLRFIATGDQAYMDDAGHVYILGRYKDLIIRGGENISPLRIEQCLGKSVGVLAQVIGVPDKLAGEIPVAVLTQSGHTKVSHEEIQRTVLSELGPGFAPSMVLDLQEDLKKKSFPTTVSGKVQKTVLRQWVLEYLSNTDTTQVIPSNNTLESQLTRFWAALSGLDAANLSADVPVQTFTDSMMLIQFCALVREKLQKDITIRELKDFNTIRMQVKLLENRERNTSMSAVHSQGDTAKFPLQTLLQVLGNENRIEAIKQCTSARLAPLGLSWDDVEDVVPMTDTMTLMSRGMRPNAWNHRHTIVIKSTTYLELKSILQTWVQRHPLMRTTTVSDGTDIDFYLVMKACDNWIQHQLIDGEEVESADCLLTYRLNDVEWDYVSPAGPLFKATILPLHRSSEIGLILHWHHAIFDGLIIKRWYAELIDLLNHESSALPFHPFRDFAETYYTRRHGELAQKGVEFHAKRLQGIASSGTTLWPIQKAPGWLKGADWGWMHPNGTPGQPSERVLLDGDKSCGTMGSNRTIHVPKILDLRLKYEISPPIVTKAACAMFNLYKTGAEEAVFVSVESGRSWPLVEDNEYEGRSINPLTIDGPTMTETINRIRVLPDETVRQFLIRIRDEQRDIDLYSHTPIAAILDRLAMDPVNGEADVRAVKDILQRQIYDWLPSTRPMNQEGPEKPQLMEILECLGRTDLGIVWFPTLLKGEVLHLEATWDDAQLRASEAHEAMSEFLCSIAWLSEPANLDRRVQECEYTGYEITDIGPFENYRR